MTNPARAGASAGLLLLWERGASLPPVQRAMVLADEGPAALGLPAGEEPPPCEPLGLLHARLLRLRSAVFGDELAATAPCPACGAAVEFGLDASVLTEISPAGEIEPVDVAGHHVVWRSPTAADLAALAAETPDVDLLRRCVRVATGPDGAPVDPALLPDTVRAAVASAMEQADPLAEVRVEALCPACGTAFACDVDIVDFVWTEIAARAKRVLLDIDVLARAYGWTEADVLALSDARRAAYLRIVDEGMP